MENKFKLGLANNPMASKGILMEEYKESNLLVLNNFKNVAEELN